jgi:hypothetical protein
MERHSYWWHLRREIVKERKVLLWCACLVVLCVALYLVMR